LKKNIECLCTEGKFDDPHMTCFPGIDNDGNDICRYQLTYIYRGTCKKG
jgi:hypothetical protein